MAAFAAGAIGALMYNWMPLYLSGTEASKAPAPA